MPIYLNRAPVLVCVFLRKTCPKQMDESLLCKDVLGVIFSFLPGQYSTFVRLCKEAKNILTTDGWDALEEHGVWVDISDQCIQWYKNCETHRDGDLPAVYITSNQINGTYKWYKHDKLHRDGGLPAIVKPHKLVWYKNGMIHRDGDLPAVICRRNHEKYMEDGYSVRWYDAYYKNGVLHRDGDLSAYIDIENDRLMWYQNGKLHREKGPAVFIPSRLALYYLNGKLTRLGDKPAYIEREYDAYELIWYIDGVINRDNSKPVSYHHCSFNGVKRSASRLFVGSYFNYLYEDDYAVMWGPNPTNYIIREYKCYPAGLRDAIEVLNSHEKPEDLLVGFREGISNVNELISWIPERYGINDDDLDNVNTFFSSL